MIEARGETCFVEKHLHESRFFVAAAQLLDHDELVETSRARRCSKKDVRHAAVAERREQTIFSGEKIALGDRPQTDRGFRGPDAARGVPLSPRSRMTRHSPFLLRIGKRFKRAKDCAVRQILLPTCTAKLSYSARPSARLRRQLRRKLSFS